MSNIVVYIHGKNGCYEEYKHYCFLFPDSKVIGFDFKAETPWDAREEFLEFFNELEKEYNSIKIIANSIGAYFALNSLAKFKIDYAYFISPIVDMEQLITDMMLWANVSEEELAQKKTIETNFGETLSIEYLNWVRSNKISWNHKTYILYGSNDNLQSIDTIKKFTNNTNFDLTVMESGEHWFHTEKQMNFIDNWIRQKNN